MSNPLIVFLVPSAGIRGSALRLPLALTVDGVEVPSAQEMKDRELEVIFLDDTLAEIPELCHSNKDPGASLFVIAHRSSDWHTRATIPDNTVMRGWGLPVVLDLFSHIPGDNTFKEVLALLEGELRPQDFAESRRNQGELRELDTIAQILHLRILSEEPFDTNIVEQNKRAMRQLSPLHQQQIKDQKSPEAKLRAVNVIASRLVG